MHTIPEDKNDGRRRRRQHSDEFKAEAVTACMQPGVSVSAIALARGVNANLLRLWLRNAEMKAPGRVDGEVSTLSMPTMVTPKPTFVPMTVPAQGACAEAGHPHRSTPQCDDGHRDLAGQRGGRVREVDARAASMIRIDAMWLAAEPVDMRSGAGRLLARVDQVFGAAQAHHGYLFANARGTRMKLLMHDGFGVWCAARRLNAGRFTWVPATTTSPISLSLTNAQFDALVLGLPWERLPELSTITRA